MSKTQELVAAISGYDPNQGMGASNDCYYEEETLESKKAFLIDFVKHYEEEDLEGADIEAALNFLEFEFENSNEKWHAFNALI